MRSDFSVERDIEMEYEIAIFAEDYFALDNAEQILETVQKAVEKKLNETEDLENIGVKLSFARFTDTYNETILQEEAHNISHDCQGLSYANITAAVEGVQNIFYEYSNEECAKGFSSEGRDEHETVAYIGDTVTKVLNDYKVTVSDIRITEDHSLSWDIALSNARNNDYER